MTGSATSVARSRSVNQVDVMVVDDDPALRRLVRSTLTDDGLTVATAGNGREALSLLEECRPRAMVVDLEMPEMDGRSLIRSLRERDEDVRVIILSAHGARRAGRELEVKIALDKPFDPQDLVDHVRRAVSR